MANENQNSPQAGSSQNKIEAKDTINALKEALKLQGDYNNVLKDSVRELEKSLRTYDRLGAKLDSINQSSINTKNVEKQIQENQIKRFTTTQKLADLENKLSGDQQKAVDKYLGAIQAKSQKEKELLEAQKNGDANKAASLLSAITNIEKQIDLKSSTLNVEQLAYAQAKKSDQLYEETNNRLQEQLSTEKKINSSIGLTGKTFKLFADKLGVGSQYYEDMVLKARQLEVQNKKLSFGDKLGGLAKAAGGGIMEAITDPLTAIPLAGAAIGGLVKGLKSAFDFILGIQDQTVKFARAMNLSTQEARKIKMEFADLNVSSGELFLTSQKMVESQVELSGALGVTNRLTNEQLATDIKLKDIAGLDLETRKGIAETATITGKSSEGLTKSILSQVVGLKQTTGISFQYQKILKEASSLGGVLGLAFAKYPEKLTKSLVTVKSMGLELKQLDGIADSFLDFESSISKEFEAQLLTGKDINLTKAREAFLNNDLATAAAEITKQVGNSSEFLSMNRIQQESIAAAMGMSRNEMADMLKQQEMLSKLGARDLKDAQAKVEALKAQGKSREEIARLVGEEAYQSLTNASAQEKIAAFIDKIKQSFADFIEKSGLIEKIEGFMDYLSKPENIKKVIEGMRDFFAGAIEFVGKAAYYILEGLDYVAFGQIPDDFIDSIKSGAENMGAQIRSMGAGGISVSDKKAKNEATSTSTGATPVDNMSMARSGDSKVYNVIIVDPITGKSVEKVVNQATFEKLGGSMGK